MLADWSHGGAAVRASVFKLRRRSSLSYVEETPAAAGSSSDSSSHRFGEPEWLL